MASFLTREDYFEIAEILFARMYATEGSGAPNIWVLYQDLRFQTPSKFKCKCGSNTYSNNSTSD